MDPLDRDSIEFDAKTDPRALREAVAILSTPAYRGWKDDIAPVCLFVIGGVALVLTMSLQHLIVVAAIIGAVVLFILFVHNDLTALIEGFALGSVHVGARSIPIPIGPILVILFAVMYHSTDLFPFSTASPQINSQSLEITEDMRNPDGSLTPEAIDRVMELLPE